MELLPLLLELEETTEWTLWPSPPTRPMSATAGTITFKTALRGVDTKLTAPPNFICILLLV